MSSDKGPKYEPVKYQRDINGKRIDDCERLGGSSRVSVGPRDYRAVFWRVMVLEVIGAFGDHLWLFFIPILFQETAVYNLVLYSALMVMMPLAGPIIDRLPRMQLMTISIAGDNIFVCLAAMLTFATSLVIHDSNALWGLLGGMLACSVIGQFFAHTGCMALEKDWVPVIAGEKGSGDIRPMGEGDREDDVEVKKSLAILNSSLRRINLTCKFLGNRVYACPLM
ncbi:hypothetical protein AAMO2058_001110500 [Amorphochlora amoebiformis]